MDYEMSDIKIITVVLGAAGELCAKFDPETGRLTLWPNEQAANAPEGATHYGLTADATKWSMLDKKEGTE